MANRVSPLSRLTLPRVAALVTFAGIFAMATRPSLDTDTWWHLRAGAWMVEHHQVLTTDMFSITRYGQPWINHSWLSQIPLYLAWQAFGYAGLNLLTATLVTLTWWFVYRRCEGNAYLKAFCLVLGAAASAVFWSARPQLASFLLTAVFAYILDEYRWRGVNRLWWLPPLMILWANLHGGFAIGFILLLGTLAGQGLGALLGQHGPGQLAWRSIGQLALITAVCAAVVVINPFGLALYLVPVRTVSIGVLQQYIQEWQSPNFHLVEFQPFIWLLLAVAAALGLSRRRVDLTDLLLVCGFTYLGLVSARNVATAALFLVPLLTRHASMVLDDLRASYPELAALVRPLPGRRSLTALNAGIVGLVMVAVAVKAWDASRPVTNERAMSSLVPIGAADYLAQAQPPGPLFNAYNWGGYLSWRLYPTYRVFVDGRTDLYDDAFLGEYLVAELGQPGAEHVLDKYGINLVLVEATSPLAERLTSSPMWSESYSDSASVVFQRRQPVGAGGGRAHDD